VENWIERARAATLMASSLRLLLLRPLQFMLRRLDHLSWRFGSPLGDVRWRDQAGFRGVRKRLFTFSRGVHGIEPN
jgi:hypothetical protein